MQVLWEDLHRREKARGACASGAPGKAAEPSRTRAAIVGRRDGGKGPRALEVREQPSGGHLGPQSPSQVRQRSSLRVRLPAQRVEEVQGSLDLVRATTRKPTSGSTPMLLVRHRRMRGEGRARDLRGARYPDIQDSLEIADSIAASVYAL